MLGKEDSRCEITKGTECIKRSDRMGIYHTNVGDKLNK
jgi:hypothetical protein